MKDNSRLCITQRSKDIHLNGLNVSETHCRLHEDVDLMSIKFGAEHVEIRHIAYI